MNFYNRRSDIKDLYGDPESLIEFSRRYFLNI